jgi:hypothetical protein
MLAAALALCALLSNAAHAHADTNVKILATTFSGATTTFSQFACFNDWDKVYHRVIPGPTTDTAIFYNRVDQYFRIVKFTSGGGYQRVPRRTCFFSTETLAP